MIPHPEPKPPDGHAAVRAALAELRKGPATARDLARRSRIDESRTADLLGALERCGAVRRAEGKAGEVDTYVLAESQPFVLGVDLGGTKIHVALADLAGTVMAEKIEMTDPRGGVHVLDQIAAMAERAAGALGSADWRPLGAAIGSPGVVHVPSGRIDLSSNIPDFDKLNVVEEVRARLGCPVLLENDVNLGALGEQWHGACRGTTNFAFVALGTGIGMGLVAEGQLVRGARGAAGEIAFLPIGGDPFDPASYVLGTLETAIGSVGIVRYYRDQGGRAASTVKDIFDRLADDEPAAVATLDHVARLVAQALMAVGAMADPDIIILGGGIGSRVELLTRVQALLSEIPFAVRVRSSLLGTRAVVVGALSLALDHFCLELGTTSAQRP
jgi:predicted NBD/HSP70 family sugar kinase